jgi:hypothetical protein
MSERDETPAERADRNWGELLQELRVSQTGVQLLTAFLLSLPLQQRFTELSTGQVTVYLVAVCLSVLATGLLVAPVAVHRAVFRHHEKTVLVTAGDRIARAGLAMLALAVSDVVVLIFSIVVGTAAAVAAGFLSLGLLAGLWWWLPQRVLTRGNPSSSQPAKRGSRD